VERVMSEEGRRKGVWGLTTLCCILLVLLVAMEGMPEMSSTPSTSPFTSLITTTTTTIVEEIKNTKLFVDEEGMEERVKSVKTVWESTRTEGEGGVEVEGEADEEVHAEAERQTEEEDYGSYYESSYESHESSPTTSHNPTPNLFVVTETKIKRYANLFRPLSSIQTGIEQPKLSLPAGVEVKDVIVEKVLEPGVVVDKEMRKGFRKVMKDMIRKNEERFQMFMVQ